MSAGKPPRKSVTSVQISSFRVINPSSSFWRKSCNFLKAAAKEISAISSAARQNSGPAERRSLSSRMPTARNRYPCTNTSAPENGNGSCCSFSPWQPHPAPVLSWNGSLWGRKTSCRTAHNSPGFLLPSIFGSKRRNGVADNPGGKQSGKAFPVNMCGVFQMVYRVLPEFRCFFRLHIQKHTAVAEGQAE